ncbi:hypothetical protein GCM10009430_40200 [Aquimarina litoralis]|uniref:NodB homology domain-containing protein n=1 Tax=Aquimarina litoralis TaxID=584605 RepID=A0ABP3UFU6_9FLAO
MLWKRIKYRLRLLYTSVLLYLGFEKLLLKNRYGERILVFHGIDKVGKTCYNSRFIGVDTFEEFIKYITQHYHVISLDDFYAKKFKPNTLNITLTFDDGYYNNYAYAVPILKKYKVPASFYITTVHDKSPYLWADFVDLISYHTSRQEIVFEKRTYIKNSKNEFVANGISLKNIAKTLPYEKIKILYDILQKDWESISTTSISDYWELMNYRQIQEICSDSLFSIGAHGETHVNLIDIPINDAKKEIFNSKKTLEKICDEPIEEFAFPFGYYSKELVDYCEEIGYNKILLVDYNKDETNDNQLLRPRFVMNPYITLKQQLIYLLKGSYF